MTLHDAFGVPLTGADAAAVAHYDTALGKLMVMRNDPVAEADAATAIDPGLVMGHVLKHPARLSAHFLEGAYSLVEWNPGEKMHPLAREICAHQRPDERDIVVELRCVGAHQAHCEMPRN